MNDLQAQLEEANKEKQELQEKVRTRISLDRKRVLGSPYVEMNPQAHRIASTFLCHQQSTEQHQVQRARLEAISP